MVNNKKNDDFQVSIIDGFLRHNVTLNDFPETISPLYCCCVLYVNNRNIFRWKYVELTPEEQTRREKIVMGDGNNV